MKIEALDNSPEFLNIDKVGKLPKTVGISVWIEENWLFLHYQFYIKNKACQKKIKHNKGYKVIDQTTYLLFT